MNTVKKLLLCVTLASRIMSAMDSTPDNKREISGKLKETILAALAKKDTGVQKKLFEIKACAIVQQERIKDIPGHENFDALGRIKEELPVFTGECSYQLFQDNEEVSMEFNKESEDLIKNISTNLIQITMLNAAIKEMRNIK